MDEETMVGSDSRIANLKRQMNQAQEALNAGDYSDALQLIVDIKATRLPLEGADQLRGLAFLGLGSRLAAVEAFKEELRAFPDNQGLRQELAQLLSDQVPPSAQADECEQLLWQIRDYTMVGPGRLRSLYNLTKRICQEDRPGCFVECGVAAGGSSALMALVIARYSKRQRQIYCFDTFEGMPDPTSEDRMAGDVPAQRSGWGAGTCRAGVGSLDAICHELGVLPIVRPVQGLFRDTLPKWRKTLGEIAFLHMDGDWYESTRDILNDLYDQVSPGGLIQVDDYGHWAGCRKALHEFADRHRLRLDLHEIDGTGVWLEKPVTQQQKRRLLNLGCGGRFHPDWVNVDFASSSKQVIAHDLLQGVPFETGSFDAVYHSHVLEHFPKSQAHLFIRECHRVLKPGGILRIAVPDLETIARSYLHWLDFALEGDIEARKRYDWILLEMFDQMVRNFSGGEMLQYWRQNPMPAEEYVIERMGSEVKGVVERIRSATGNTPLHMESKPSDPESIGRFRLSGEVHQWMYDRYSLGKLLGESGFCEIAVCPADQSRIPEFNSYLLDIEPDGSVRKPDSLFVEAVRTEGNERIKFLQVHTFYGAALDDLYSRIPGLENRPYACQVEEIVKDAFSAIHIFAPYLSDFCYDPTFIVANNLHSQVQWMKEHALYSTNSRVNIHDWVKTQIEVLKPDVLYLTDPITFDGNFIAKLTHKPKLTIGWRAAVIPLDTKWNGFDMMLSLLDGLLDRARELGAARTTRFYPGFPVWIYDRIKHIQPQYDVVFCGQISPRQHARRNRLLQRIAEESGEGGFSCAYYLSGDQSLFSPEIKRVDQGAKYGLEMHKALRTGRIAVDARASHGMIDMAGKIIDDFGKDQTANMRIFEATGSGCLLLTEHFDHLSEFFDIGREIETFRSEEELIEKIRYYTLHPDERDTIARRGHERCLREHSMTVRARAFDELIKRELS